MNLKIIGKVFMSKCVGTGPSSYKKRIYRAAVSQRLRNIVLQEIKWHVLIPNASLLCFQHVVCVVISL